MNLFEAYKLFQAIKNHFTTQYDYFKYNGKIKADSTSFETRHDRFQYNKLAKHKDPLNFLVANFVDGDVKWIGSMFTDETEAVYINWLKRQQSLAYNFSCELENLLPFFDDNFIVKNGQHPPLLKLFMRKKISIDTLVILDTILQYTKHWNKNIEDTIVWPSVYTKMIKYRPFLHYEVSKYREMVRDKYKNEHTS